MGIHVSEESEKKHTTKEIWEATISTFLSKFFLAILFVIPILLFELTTAIFISVFFGLSLLTIISISLSKGGKIERFKVVAEHLIIALIVISITHFVGDWIAFTFD